jgi:hypothetical protein
MIAPGRRRQEICERMTKRVNSLGAKDLSKSVLDVVERFSMDPPRSVLGT